MEPSIITDVNPPSYMIYKLEAVTMVKMQADRKSRLFNSGFNKFYQVCMIAYFLAPAET